MYTLPEVYILISILLLFTKFSDTYLLRLIIYLNMLNILYFLVFTYFIIFSLLAMNLL